MKRFGFSLPVMTGLVVAFLWLSLSVKKDQSQNLPQLDLAGLPELLAAEEEWGAVRFSASWAKANNLFLESIINALKTANLLKTAANYQTSNVSFGKITAKIEFKVGSPAAANISSTAYAGNKDFDYQMYVWNQANDQKVLELFFDDPDTFGSNDGALLKYSLKRLDPATYTGNDAMTESYISGASGTRKQTLSWSGGPFATGGPTNNGRVVLQEIYSGAALEFRSVVLLNAATVTALKATLNPICSAATNLYYVMAFIQKTTGSAEATAKFGVTMDSTTTDPDKFCGFPNSRNYGIFSGGAFINDGVSAASILSNYPAANTTSPGYDASLTPPHVIDVFSRTGVSLTDYENTSKAKIDGLNIAFTSVAAPGF